MTAINAPIPSQIAAMSGAVATKTPMSEVARFVQADVKGGESAHNYRMAVIARAILEGFKGNGRNMVEAATFADGKAKKARAYKAGFEAVGVIGKLAYVGKWDASGNADVRALAHTESQRLEFAFEGAFLAVMAESAAPRKAKAPLPIEAWPFKNENEKAEQPAPVPQAVEVDIVGAVDAVTQGILQGVLSVDELTMIRMALASYDAANVGDVDLSHLLTSQPVLLQQQAH